MNRDERTRRYVKKRTQDGKTRREIERCLVRYIAREVYQALLHPMETGWFGYKDFAESLKDKRIKAGLTQSDIAVEMGVVSARISDLERAVLIDERMLLRYRDCLETVLSKRRWKSLN